MELYEIVKAKYQCSALRFDNGYGLFVSEYMKKTIETNINVGVVELMTLSGNAWRKMGETEQEVWHKRSNQNDENKIARVMSWIRTMDEVSVESCEWADCWSNPNSNSNKIKHKIKPVIVDSTEGDVRDDDANDTGDDEDDDDNNDNDDNE